MDHPFPETERCRTGGADFRSVLFRDGREAWSRAVPDHFRDLNLDQVVAAATAGREEYDLHPFFHERLRGEVEVEYRQAVMRDIEQAPIREAMEAFAAAIRAVRRFQRQAEALRVRLQAEWWFLHAVAGYCDAVRALDRTLDGLPIGSDGLAGLRRHVAGTVAADRFGGLESAVADAEQGLAVVRYSVLARDTGFNVRPYAAEEDYSAEIEAVFRRFQQGGGADHRAKFTEPVAMNHIEAKVLEFVATLQPEPFERLHRFRLDWDGFADEVIVRFDREVQFYLAWHDLRAPLRARGLPFCYPTVSATDQAIHDDDTFDLALAIKLARAGQEVIPNDVRIDGEERILVVSGPNGGGKTTFARTIGQLHHLAALGCPVPGRDARLFLPDAIFTHFEREEAGGEGQGKLEDELVRVHAILSGATGRSVVVLNEIFASTTLDDALFLGTAVMRRIMTLGCLCVCVTFLTELSALGPQTVSAVSVVDPADPARRTHKVVRRPADGVSHAASLAAKHRITLGSLRERLARRAEAGKAVS